jgi:hypothetical protein
MPKFPAQTQTQSTSRVEGSSNSRAQEGNEHSQCASFPLHHRFTSYVCRGDERPRHRKDNRPGSGLSRRWMTPRRFAAPTAPI